MSTKRTVTVCRRSCSTKAIAVMSHAPPAQCLPRGNGASPRPERDPQNDVSLTARPPVVFVSKKGPNRRERATSIPIRLACMASEGDDGPLVGRTGTLAEVQSDLRNVGPGGTAAVFVTGEAGVGKSRLLRETAETMRGAGVAVLSGTCLDIGDASPLHPVLQALRRFDHSGQTTGADDAGALPERVSRDLRAIAGERRLLLVLDDLQWADRSTRQLLLYLLAGLGDIKLSVLAAVRAEALHGAHPLRRVLAELRRLRSVRVVELSPLDREQTLELVTAIAGDPVEPEDADRVYK